MKDNKLFSAMSYIDEELIHETLNAPKKQKPPVVKLTATAAALVFIALSAAILVNMRNQPDIIADPETSNTQTSSKEENTKSKEKDYSDESSSLISDGDYSIPTTTIQESQNSQLKAEISMDSPKSQTSQTSYPNAQVSTNTPEQTEESTIEPPTSEISYPNIQASTPESQASEQTPIPIQDEEEEPCEMLGFIVWNGKTYMQVFNKTEYTLDKEIGSASDFKGAYHNLDDNSKVYTVKEDEKILIVKFEAGDSVTLMLWNETIQDRMGYYFFNGLRVDSSLYAALNSNDGKTYSIYATRPDSDDMYDYVYNGKTLRQMKEELDESWKTADGKNNPLYDEYQAALDAFLKEKIKNIYHILIENGIKAEIINEVRCEAEITKEQFEAFAAANNYLDEYAFGLSSGGYVTEDEPGPVFEDEPFAE